MHFPAQLIADINTQLEDWFSKQLPRGQTVLLRDLVVGLPAAHIAAHLYKRQGIQLEGCPPPRPSVLPQDTQVQCYKTWNACFQQEFFTNAEIIVDKNVLNMLPHSVSLKNKAQALHPVVATEANKNLATVFALANQLSDKTTAVVSLGGGITSDIAGCAAGLTGKQLIVIPTTWLAGIDAAMGGKNGVNHAVWGKNQIGLFLNPQLFVLVDEAFQSLPRTAFLCGFAEALKHAFLANDPSLSNATHLAAQPVTPSAFIQPHLEFKRGVVVRDPFEHTIRRLLNFGHTYAHVLEMLGEQGFISSLPHGAAVALGMLIKTQNLQTPQFFSDALSQLTSELLQTVSFSILKMEGLQQAAVTLFNTDKKRTGKHVVLINAEAGLLTKSGPVFPQTYLLERSAEDLAEHLLQTIRHYSVQQPK